MAAEADVSGGIAMLKRETFIQAMQAICTQEMYMDQLNEIYRKATDGQGMLVLDGAVHAALLKTLADAMDDQYQYIEWWLYAAPEDDKVVSWEDNGGTSSVDLADVDALYDFLVKSANERRNVKRE